MSESLVPRHGLPLPEHATASDLAEFVGLPFREIAARVYNATGMLIPSNRPLTRDEATQILRLFDLQPVDPIPPQTADAVTRQDIPSIAERIGIPVGEILGRIYEHCGELIPTNRELTDDELEVLASACSVDVDAVLESDATPDVEQKAQEQLAALRERLLRLRAKHEAAQALESEGTDGEVNRGDPVRHDGDATRNDLVAEARFLMVDQDDGYGSPTASERQQARTTGVQPVSVMLEPESEEQRVDLSEAGPFEAGSPGTDAEAEERKRYAQNALQAVLENPHLYDRSAGAFLYSELGEEVGLQLIHRSLESREDSLAEGVGVGWTPAYDRIYWELREYPRARPRRPLTCIAPGSFIQSTRIDPRLSVEERAFLERDVLPVLLLDRDKEVRRRARIASMLLKLPHGVEIPFHHPPFRWMRSEIERYQRAIREGTAHQFVLRTDEPEDRPAEVEEIVGELTDPQYYDTTHPDALVERAFRLLADPRILPAHRDYLDFALSRWGRLTVEQLIRAVELAAGDYDLVWWAAHHPNADIPVWRRALHAFPHDLGLIGCVIGSRKARNDPTIHEILTGSDHPHVLYNLARARVAGMTARAFHALVPVDVERAIRILEQAEQTGRRIDVSPREWRAMIESSDPSLRDRLRQLHR